MDKNKTAGVRAVDIFTGHCNCSQSVLGSLLPELGVGGDAEALLLKSAIGFGGGMGGSGQICGAVSGGIMALSLSAGYNGPGDVDKKPGLYEKVEILVSEVKKRYGIVSCDGIKEAGEADENLRGDGPAGHLRVCDDIVGFVAARVREMIGS